MTSSSPALPDPPLASQAQRPLCRQRAILDADLAALYGVTTKRLNEQVKRNIDRFPEDFLFQLSDQEAAALRSQLATLKPGCGQHRKYLPYAFTEQGVAMLSSVLGSERAITAILSAIRELMHPPAPKRRGIGFTADLGKPK